MSYKIVQGSTLSDTINDRYSVSAGSPDTVVTFPDATGVASLGSTMIASGIITMSPTPGNASGSATVNGLQATDVVLTSISTDASGSTSRFFVNVDSSADTISSIGYALSGSTFATCHYVVYRQL